MIYVPADAPKAGFFSPLRLWLPYFSLSLSLSLCVTGSFSVTGVSLLCPRYQIRNGVLGGSCTARLDSAERLETNMGSMKTAHISSVLDTFLDMIMKPFSPLSASSLVGGPGWACCAARWNLTDESARLEPGSLPFGGGLLIPTLLHCCCLGSQSSLPGSPRRPRRIHSGRVAYPGPLAFSQRQPCPFSTGFRPRRGRFHRRSALDRHHDPSHIRHARASERKDPSDGFLTPH